MIVHRTKRPVLTKMPERTSVHRICGSQSDAMHLSCAARTFFDQLRHLQ